MATTYTYYIPNTTYGTIVTTDVIVEDPSIGSLSVDSGSTSSNFIVTYNPPSGSTRYVATSIKLYCHACSSYVATSSSGTLIADLASLVNAGHIKSTTYSKFTVTAEVAEAHYVYVTTRVYNNTGGTATPVSETYSVVSGGSVTIPLRAVASTGYVFKSWECDQKSSWSSTSASLDYTISNVTSDEYRDFVAYFDHPTYKVEISANISFIPSETSSYRTQMDLSPNLAFIYYSDTASSVSDVNIAIASCTYPNEFAEGDTVTVSMRNGITSEGERLGFKFWRWRCPTATPTIGYQFKESFSFTMPAHNVMIYVEIAGPNCIKCIANVNSYLYGFLTTLSNVSGLASMLPALYPDGTEDPDETHCRQVTGYYSPGDTCPLIRGISLWKEVGAGTHGTVASDLAFIHGTSKQLTRGSGYYRWTTGSTDETVTIFMCTDRLVHNDDSALLCKPPELVYDCNVPSGQTVYPLPT